jgi:endonuclease YncB( thermonuclease family)
MVWRECARGRAGRRAAFGLVLCLGLIGLGAHLAPGDAQTLFGAVVRVVDGDTIHVQLGDRVEKVRYIGMNTPETHHPTRGEEPGGREPPSAPVTLPARGGALERRPRRPP